MGAIETLIDNVDSMILGFVQGSFGSLTASIHILWQLMFIVFIAVYGYKVMISGRFSASDMIVHCVKIIIILVVATQWDTFFTIAYNMVTDFPNDIAGQILQGSTNTLGSNAQPTDQMTANSGLSNFFDRGMKIVQKILEGAGLTDFGLYLYAGIVFMGTVCFAGYAGMLIILSKIAVAILLAVGPIFILLLIFSNSRGLFEGWLRTLLNYSVIPIFVYTLLAFLLSLAERPLENLEEHSSVTQALLDGVAPYALVTFISTLLLMQIMNMAASVTGGLSLSTMRGPSWGLGKGMAAGMLGGKLSVTTIKAAPGAAVYVVDKAKKGSEFLKNSLKKNKEAQ
ncbi:MAG: type IV secretion system protein [Micavibrio sp.]